MAGFGDILGGFGSGLGAMEGQQETEAEKAAIMKAIADQKKAAGQLDPSQLAGSGFDKISTDPKTREAQMAALNNMMGLGQAGGLDPQALAANAQSEREAAGYEQSQRQALSQSMAARGMGGSGAEVAGLLAGQQGGANRVAAADQQNAGDARNRALTAMMNAGQLGGAVRSQDYGEAADRARADDAARQHVWDAGMQKYGAQRDANKEQYGAWAADRANTINQRAAAGNTIGSSIGGFGDIGLSAATGGATGLPKGPDMQGLSSMNPAKAPEDEWANPYGSWGGK